MSKLCRLGLHSWPRYVNAYTQAPAQVRCLRCGTPYRANRSRDDG